MKQEEEHSTLNFKQLCLHKKVQVLSSNEMHIEGTIKNKRYPVTLGTNVWPQKQNSTSYSVTKCVFGFLQQQHMTEQPFFLLNFTS